MPPKAPVAPRRKMPLPSPLHLADDWKWLENLEDKETKKYLKAENKFYRDAMKPFAALQDELFHELKARMAEDDASVPEKDGDYWYYVRYQKGSQYPIYCRKKLNLEAPEEVYFDHNAIAEKLPYCDLAYLDVSPDHSRLAFAIDDEGNERYTLRVIDIASRVELMEPIENVSASFEWKTNHSFFYIPLDENDRPLELYFRAMEEDDAKLIYTESDPSFFLSIEASESEEYLFLSANGYEANEIWFHPMAADHTRFELFLSRDSGQEYELTHHGSDFLVITNHEAVNYQIFRTPVSRIGAEHWQLVQAHDPEVLIEGLSVFRDFWVVSERYRAVPRLRVVPQNSYEAAYWIDFPEEAYELSVSDGRDYAAPSFRFWVSTPRMPQTLYDFVLATREKTLLKKRPLGPHPFHEQDYEVKRLWAHSRDGHTQIPITLLMKKGHRGPQNLVLHSYGSYGESLDCDFSVYRMTLVDRGFTYAMAHVRGGMELGRSWYLDGKLEKKWNTFHDYIDVADYLVKEGYTAAGAIIAEGSSAGGMLMGVLANERPELFLGIVASVPFVDVLNTMLDPNLPLTTLEYQEWGNPNVPADYERIKSYSPYENVKNQAYPHMLVVAGLHDQRVMYWEAAKWVARLRAEKTDENILLLKVDEGAGHGGATGRYDALSETAEELSFMLMLKARFGLPG